MYASKSQSHRNQIGFTLVELLTVVAILAVLSGMMLPALGVVRDSARSTKCRSNLRQFGMGCLLYAEEWEGRPTPYAVIDGLGGTNSYWRGLNYELMQFLDITTWKGSIVDCPSNRWGYGGTPAIKGVGYAINYNVGYTFHPSDSWLQPGKIWSTVAEIGKPSRTAWYFDAPGMNDNLLATHGINGEIGFSHVNSPATYANPALTNLRNEVMWNRHRGLANGLFVDGRVDGFTYDRALAECIITRGQQ